MAKLRCPTIRGVLVSAERARDLPQKAGLPPRHRRESTRKSGSHATRRWKEMDSNLRFPVREVVISAFAKWNGSR
jgi:hypothetical protein